MTVTINFDKNTGEKIGAYINVPMKKTRDYFNLLGLKIDQQTQLNFRMFGARLGHKQWTGYSMRTLHPSWKRANGIVVINIQKWNKRPGTDGNKNRKYNSSSKMFQASGGFRQSFRILNISGKKITYGSRLNLAKKIIRKKSSPYHRPILFVEKSDKKIYQRMFVKFYKRGLIQ